MSRRIDRRTVIVDGREMVAVPPAHFERLDASRRQVGARSARALRTFQQLQDAQRRLRLIESILTERRDECVCDRVAAALRESPRQNGSPAEIRSRRRS